jgi:hypothetical protein
MLTTSPPFASLLYRQCEILNISQSCRPPLPVTGIAFPFLFYLHEACIGKCYDDKKNWIGDFGDLYVSSPSECEKISLYRSVCLSNVHGYVCVCVCLYLATTWTLGRILFICSVIRPRLVPVESRHAASKRALQMCPRAQMTIYSVAIA